MNSTNKTVSTREKWIGYLKKGYAAILIVILGLIMLLAFGFNKSFEYTGGTIVSVNATTYSETDAKAKINEVFNNNKDAKVCVFTVGTSNDEKVITIKYQISNNVDETNSKILSELYSAFGYSQNDTVEENYITMVTHIEPAYNSAVFTYAIMGVLISAIVVALYIWIRYGLGSAFVLLATTFIDILCGLALILLFRADISSNMSYAIMTMGVLSIMFNMFTLYKLRENSFKDEFKKATNTEVADATTKYLLRPYTVAFCFGLIAFLILTLISGPITGMAVISIALTFVAIFVTSLFVNPTLWAIVYKRRVRSEKAKTPVELGVESEDETV